MGRPRALLALGLAATLLSAPVHAQAPARSSAAPPKAKLDGAAFHLQVLMSALQSKQVDQPIKNVLFACLYENAFQKISDATDKVIAGNKLDPKDANKVLTVMAGVCGLRPGGSAEPKATPQSPPPGR